MLSPVETGVALVGLAPKQNSKPPNWNVKHYESSGVFINFYNIKPPRTNAKLPNWKLSSNSSESAIYSSFVHKNPNFTQMKQEFEYLRAQRHGHPKILGGSKCLILGEQQYCVW